MVQMPQTLASPPADWPSDWFEPVSACLWCASTASKPDVEGVQDWFFGAVPGEFSFARCCDCGSLFLEKRPVPAHLAQAYSGYYTHSDEPVEAVPAGLVRKIGSALAAGYARQRFGASSSVSDAALAALFRLFPVRKAEIDAKSRYLPPAPANVLDYGCGNGDFLARAAGLGHLVTGVDFDALAVAQARKRGILVLEPHAAEVAEFASRFDHVTAVHLIEHIADPVQLLRDFRRWLKPGGCLFLEMPNAGATGLGKYGRFWRGLEAPRHFSLPSEAGLKRALAQAGFAPVRLGHRAFAHQFMDAASSAASRAHGQTDAPEPQLPIADLTGPEVLVCLARAV